MSWARTELLMNKRAYSKFHKKLRVSKVKGHPHPVYLTQEPKIFPVIAVYNMDNDIDISWHVSFIYQSDFLKEQV